jgi:hypothetical protein
VQLSLAANEEFARAPINIVNPDRNNFSCAQPKPSQKWYHGIVASPHGGVRSHGGD